ncbi:MAG: glycosyltransferase [Solirubrobacteraceae bacterium]
MAVVAEWYPSRTDPVHGIWAHRQAVAVRDAGVEVRVVSARRPIPPISVLRRGPRAVAEWLGGIAALLAPWELDGIPITSAPFVSPPRPLSYGAWGYWITPSVSRALKALRARWPFDLVHAHCVTPPGFAAARWRRRQGGPVAPALAVSTHGPDVISVHERSRWARRATAVAFDAADVVIANSGWAAARCQAIAGRPLPIEVVHLGADLPMSGGGRRARPTIATLAHLVARKRHVVVLHALASLPEAQRPDYVVIGDGPGRPELTRLARELGVTDSVQTVGQLDNERAVAALARCHLFVMPSVNEPFGVAYVEAMAAGLPVIALRGEGGPEDIAAVGDGIVLVPRDDHRALAAAIASELRDPVRLAARGAAARETVANHFTWAHCAARTVKAYERALAGRANKP